MDDMLIKFKEVVDEEIQAYEALGELYEIKQSILVQGKSDALWDIDAQIVNKADNIKELNQKRKAVAKYLGDENITLSEVIEKAKNSNDDLANKIIAQKAKLLVLSKSIALQEKTIMTLVKHGLIMVGKTLDIIAGVILPHSKQYNKNGQNIEMDKSSLSSIVQEA